MYCSYKTDMQNRLSQHYLRMYGTAGDHFSVQYIPQIIANALIFKFWFYLLLLFLLIDARVLYM